MAPIICGVDRSSGAPRRGADRHSPGPRTEGRRFLRVNILRVNTMQPPRPDVEAAGLPATTGFCWTVPRAM